jgi:GTP-binding protein HflX
MHAMKTQSTGSSRTHTTEKPRQKAVLFGVQLPRVTDEETKGSLQELARLVDTLGYAVIGSLSQKRQSTGGGVVIGEGKLQELAEWTGGSGEVQSSVEVKKHKAAERFHAKDEVEDLRRDQEQTYTGEKADVVVFDCELSPSQMRNLESATGARVLDRTGVIIEIFSRHARTRAARLQVEIARLNYMAPRIRETGGGEDRGGGGVGAKGAGETSQELDRRRIRDRVKELKEELESVQGEHLLRRSRRSSEACAALVGYTNAGKSSMMRAMTGSEVLIADKLFATLETTVRPVHPETMPKILLSDTVGFIKKLPHDLVASFRSTLDEALNADLLLYLVDAADPTFRSQLETTKTVMKEIGADQTPSRLILNKRDKLSAEQIEELRKEFPDALFMSTRDPQDLAMLREELMKFFEQDMVEEDVMVPYTVQGAIGEIREKMRVVAEAYDNDGVKFRVRATVGDLENVRKKFSL